MILSGANSYAGGTWVRDGTLIVTTASALPSGTSLTVGGGGIFVFDPSQAAAPSSAAGSAAIAPDIAAARETSSPIVAASAVVDMPVVAFMISAVSPFLQSQLENPYCGPVATEISTGPATAAAASDVVDAPPAATRAALSSTTIDAVFKSGRLAFDQAIAANDLRQSTGPWEWVAAMESSWNSCGENQKTPTTVEPMDKVFARYGL